MGANMVDRTLEFQRRVFDCSHIRWADTDIARLAQHYGVDGSRAIEAVTRNRKARRAAKKERLLSADATLPRYTFAISSGNADRLGDVIDQNGIELARYKNNPIVLWAHDSTQLPIGRATSIYVMNNRLQATMQFGSGRFAKGVEEAVRNGTVNATSIGFQPLAWDFSRNRSGGIDFAKIELLEFSIVPIPANADCLLLGMADPTGKSVDARAKRARDLEVIKLRHAPLTPREQRELDLARFKRA
jgi:HK97 family phage prohead protease